MSLCSVLLFFSLKNQNKKYVQCTWHWDDVEQMKWDVK